VLPGGRGKDLLMAERRTGTEAASGPYRRSMGTEGPAGVTAFTHHLTGWLRRLMPPGPRLDRLTADLEAGFADRPEPLTAASCRAVEARAQAHARHLELHFDPQATAAPDTEARGWPPAEEHRIRSRAAGIREVERLDDGTFTLALDTLDAVAVARPYVEAAFALAHGATRLILDLRGNGGGDPATVALVAGHLLGGDAELLSEVVYRDRRRQWWTEARPVAASTPPLAVLVSSRTYSSAEALAYHLQARGRATVVGEPTRGAADHVTPVRLTAEVLGLLPEATVIDARTGANWEGVGVRPDVPCAAGDAWAAAPAHRPA
jgi:Peptidase family S41